MTVNDTHSVPMPLGHVTLGDTYCVLMPLEKVKLGDTYSVPMPLEKLTLGDTYASLKVTPGDTYCVSMRAGHQRTLMAEERAWKHFIEVRVVRVRVRGRVRSV